VVPESNMGGKQVQNDRRVDEVDALPYGVRYPRGRGGGGPQGGMRNLVCGEGDGGGDFP